MERFSPLATPRPIVADVRVISATNRDLTVEVEAGRFRKDLFYRLNVATLRVPPLRSRPEDVKELARHFARVYSKQYGKAEHRFTSEEMTRLVTHNWPGNVRELESCIKRLTLFGVSNRHRTAAQRAETIQGFTRDLPPYFEDGRIRPLVDRTFAFAELPAAIQFMESDGQVGKIVVRGS